MARASIKKSDSEADKTPQGEGSPKSRDSRRKQVVEGVSPVEKVPYRTPKSLRTKRPSEGFIDPDTSKWPEKYGPNSGDFRECLYA